MKRVRVTIAKIARGIPLLNASIHSPSMEANFKQTRAHPWWNACINCTEVADPVSDCPDRIIGQDPQLLNTTSANLGFQAIISKFPQCGWVSPFPIEKHLHVDFSLNAARWARLCSNPSDHIITVNSDGPQGAVNSFDSPSS